jgi:hypothetical protein
MITKETLRIGNYTLLGEVVRIDQHVAEIKSFRDGVHTNKFAYIPPLELTEDWVLELGFKKWGDNNTYSKGPIIIHYRKRKGVFVIRKSYQDLKYVHQLQNIYLDLVGKPLKRESLVKKSI